MNIKYFRDSLFYSFPFQLFFLLIKKNHLLLIYWLIFFGFVTQSFMNGWGIPYLFLDPEYLGKVGFTSLFIIGMCCGGFIMAFNISSYILNGFRFPFLATLTRPFNKYVLNNSIVPLLFLGVYIYEFVTFQLYTECQAKVHILLGVAGFLTGIFTTVFLMLTYFFTTNKDIFRMFGVMAEPNPAVSSAMSYNKKKKEGKEWRVETYFSSPFRIRLTRSTSHYDPAMIRSVFRQNHLNAAIIQVVTIVLVLVLGLFRENPFFQIPAGGSIVLLFAIFVMISGAFRFWLRGWSSTVFIVVFFILNYFSGFEFFNKRNHAYGLNYNVEKATYSYEELNTHSNQATYDADYANALGILERWKKRVTYNDTLKKPKLVIISSSGGGLRSALWTFRTMQVVDSVLQGTLFQNTQLITGSSGGMVGAGYFRELYLMHLNGKLKNYHHNNFLVNVSKDILNPVAFSLTVSDMFFNMQYFQLGQLRYKKDRAYALEKQLNENTGNVLNKKVSDYVQYERAADIPTMILCPTILNDGRRLLISAQPLSYLTYTPLGDLFHYTPEVDAIELSKVFKNQGADNLLFTSALRMSATFPYITPTVSLPSNPVLEVFDAGMRDNFGVRIAIKYLYALRGWIKQNTSGVILIQIRDTPKQRPVEQSAIRSIMDNITSPIGSFYGNFARIQDYNHDEYFEYMSTWLDNRFEFIQFELPRNEKQQVSLSWHLTTREKSYIYNAINLSKNQESLSRLKALLSDQK